MFTVSREVFGTISAVVESDDGRLGFEIAYRRLD